MIPLNDIFQFNEIARKDAKTFHRKRDLFQSIKIKSGKHFIGIIGPRGVGKTVLLKQILNENADSFYIAMDSIEEIDFFETVKILHEKYEINTLLIDEIHSLKNRNKLLKQVYDFLNIRVIFTSSVALSMYDSSYDLSRRVKLLTLSPFSFREYLVFKENIELPKLTIIDIINKIWERQHLMQEYKFNNYLIGGIMPFSLDEPDIMPLVKNILDKIIQNDIPSFTSVRLDDLSNIKKVLKFIGRSSAEGINYFSISRNTGITRYKAEMYIDLLEKAFVLHRIFPSGTNVLKEPKILMALPYRLLFKPFEEIIGQLREDFFAEIARMKGFEYYYLKSNRGEKTPDFMVHTEDGPIIIEVGGKGKGREQFKGIAEKKKLILSHNGVVEGIKRPLYLFGFLN